MNRLLAVRCYPVNVRLYEPINTLKAFGEELWIADGPVVKMDFVVGSIPFPTRMVIVRLDGEDLFVWSPTELEDKLREEIEGLGRVRHLVSPNKLHYAHIAAWKRAYPDATAWASPGVRKRAASQNIDVSFDAELGSESEPEWSGELDQLMFRSRLIQEVVFFHRKSKTVILADLIENFQLEKLHGPTRLLVWLAGATDPDGKAPLDMRLSFFRVKDEARTSLRRMLEWEPEKVVMAHGRTYERNGVSELRRAFRWLGS